jgi:ferredoxin-NADP reductase/MOSC domain-containing protein YiiM/ferredoxin
MAKLISVNVGLPAEVPWRGKLVRTAIWKRPVEGKVFAGRLNLAGDKQADLVGHGGEQRAVMVYQLDSYRYWSDFLGRSDFEPGQFGENFTVEGLADSDVCIGDRYRIGGAVFEVTQPRVTCWRLGIRMGNDQMPALVVAHRRPGFYFRVIEEGEIGAGDAIEKIADGPERMSVAEIDQLLYSAQHPVDALQRAVRISALSPGWQRALHSLLDAELAGRRDGNAGLSSAPPAPSWNGVRRLQIVASKRESEDIRSFDLAADDGSRLPDALPGQHLILKLQTSADSAAVLRNYSLCGPPDQGFYRIAVKRERDGIASGYLHERAKIGDMLEVFAPRGSFVLEPEASPVVLVSAGVGITPLLAMLQILAEAEKQSPREVWWIHSARDGAHHPFAAEVRDLLAGLSKAHSMVFYTRPSEEDRRASRYDAAGRVDLALLQKAGLPLSATFYLCGPTGFMDAVTSGLRQLGVPFHRTRSELFGPAAAPSHGVAGPAPHPPEGERGSGPLVTFVRSGLAVPWDSRFGSLLELAEACDVPAQWSCRSGVCHTCECGIIDGKLAYSPDPIDPPRQGAALICCSTPRTAVSLDI